MNLQKYESKPNMNQKFQNNYKNKNRRLKGFKEETFEGDSEGV